MNSDSRDHFPDRYIDDIREDPENNYFTPVLKDALGMLSDPGSVCDIGCGNGVFSAVIKRWSSCHLVGVDGSEYALEQAKDLGFDELHQIDDFSSCKLPFHDGSFDLVLNKDVLEHVLYPEHLVGEIARIVRTGGHALIHVPNHFPIVGRLRLLFRNTIDPFDYFPDSNRWDFPHIRFFTMASLVALFGKYHLEMVSDMNARFFSPGRLGRILPYPFKGALCRHWPDGWTEGYTILFQKRH